MKKKKEKTTKTWIEHSCNSCGYIAKGTEWDTWEFCPLCGREIDKSDD